MMGEATPLRRISGLVAVTVSQEPQFLTFSGPASRVQFAGTPLQCESPVYAAPGESVTLPLSLRNPLAGTLRGTITLSIGGGWTVTRTKIPAVIASEQQSQWRIAVRAPATIRPAQTLRVTFESPQLPAAIAASATLKSALVIPRVTSPVTPGDSASLPPAPVMILGRANMVSLYDATPMHYLQYHGDEDLSARVTLQRVPQGLRLSVRVVDDIFAQDNPAGLEWQGDSLQFAIALPSGESYEWTAALARTGPVADLDLAPTSAATGPTVLPESIVREGNVTRYDLIIPKTLPGGRTLPDRFSFTLLVNDDDGAGRKGWLEWTPGIGRAKDPAQFQAIVVR